MIDFFSQVVAVVLGLFMSLMSTTHREPTRCDTHEGVEYCFYRGEQNTDRIVYFLHGFGNDVTAWGWNPVTGDIEADWTKTKIKKPHVVTLSLGKVWWYDGLGTGKKLNDFVTWFEAKEGMTVPPFRVLYGDSMGGHNSFRWAHDYPQLFSRLALICPGLPLSFAKKIRGSEGWWPINRITDLFVQSKYEASKLKNPLRDQEFWKGFTPLPPVHLIVSNRDHFGFYSSGVELYEEIKSQPHSTITFEEQDVFHCMAETDKLSAFLAN